MKMKKFLITLLSVLFVATSANAVNMVEVQSYLNVPVHIIGIPDFPPFAYYEADDRGIRTFHSILHEPLVKALKKHNVRVEDAQISGEEADNVKLLLVKAKSGGAEAFIGAYADTKLFSGLEIIYPAIVFNPVHLITLSGNETKIKTLDDLKNMRVVASRTEYYSDFVLRKFKELNVQFVNSPYEAYEAVITGKADYMFGSMYYNRIMASRYGVGDYLKYSKNPVWNIPFFVALSKMMPVLSEYKRVLSNEFENPEFAEEVKQEILDAVNEEVNRNAGIVPPSFIKEIEQKQEFDDDEEVEENEAESENKASSGHIVKKEVHQKTIDEVLDGI